MCGGARAEAVVSLAETERGGARESDGGPSGLPSGAVWCQVVETLVRRMRMSVKFAEVVAESCCRDIRQAFGGSKAKEHGVTLGTMKTLDIMAKANNMFGGNLTRFVVSEARKVPDRVRRAKILIRLHKQGVIDLSTMTKKGKAKSKAKPGKKAPEVSERQKSATEVAQARMLALLNNKVS